MNKINFYDKNTIKSLEITFPDIYFTSEYGEACEYSDNAEWECCVFKDLIYVYLKKRLDYDNKIYYNLITPYGYSGYKFDYETTYDEFIDLFREKAKERNYISEIVRQNPYLSLNIKNYDIICNKTLYSIQIDNFNDYFKNIIDNKKRNMYNKAIKNNFKFDILPLTIELLNEKFLNLYNFTMDKVKAQKYYYFNTNYFVAITKMKNIFLSVVYDKDNNTIGSCILFIYNNYIHYHLSCNNNSNNCITDFLLISIVKELGIKKTIILGCGLKDDDKLSKFKCSLSTQKYSYNIYKNIINNEIYNKLNKDL